MTDIRRLAADDIDGLHVLPISAFAELDRQRGRTPHDWDEARLAWWKRRMAHLLDTDPSRQWVAVDAGEIVGVAAASVREGLWGLSLLVVRPGRQGGGVGRRLVDAALAGHTGPGVICASDDGRALRRYAVAGFAVYPCLEGSGPADLAAYQADRRVREGVDPEFADAVDRIARGHGHGPDHAFIQGAPGFALRYEDGGRRAYAYVADRGWISLLAGTDADAARAVLWAAVARAVELGVDATLGHVTGRQQWALDVLVAARLPLSLGGAVCWRGRPEPTPYIPHGAFL